MIEQNLRSYLLSQPAIAAMVGNRMYPLQLPQNPTLPALTYQRIAGSSTTSYDGSTGDGNARIQIDCWGRDSLEPQALAEAVRVATAGVVVPMGNDPAVASRIVNIVDVPEPEVTLWRRMVEVRLRHQEA